MQFFVQELQKRVNEWREAGYPSIYPETRNILAHIERRNFLHEPQKEALETYIYLKEVMDNQTTPEVVAQFAMENTALLKHFGFTDESLQYFIQMPAETQIEELMKKLEQIGFADYGYANYVLALTMGAGKTILMGVLLMYEFVVSFKHSSDRRFAKNALVFGPADTGIVKVLAEIKTFDYSAVIPDEYSDILLNVKYHYLEKPETPLQLIPKSNYNIIVTNSSKIILKNWKDAYSGNTLFDLRRNPVNKRLSAIRELSSLGVFVDEAHHSYGEKVTEALNQSRKTINWLSEKSEVVSVVNFTGTPYVKNNLIPDTVYMFGLQQGMEKGILKLVNVTNHGSTKDVQSEEFVESIIETFWNEYGEKRLENRLPKIAFYTTDITMLEQLEQNLDKALKKRKIALSKKLVWHSTFSGDKKNEADYEFNRLDTPESQKQFILLVNKGTEGWNCKSLVAVALYKNSSSNNFVLQASCRCLRRIGDNSVKARIFLSDENYKVLNRELENNFNTNISQLTGESQEEVPVDLVVEKRRTIKVKKELIEIISSRTKKPEEITISLKKSISKKAAPIIQEREIILDENGRAIYKDPIIKDAEKTIEIHNKREFGYYEIVSIIQKKTHFSFAEIDVIFASNEIDRAKLIKAVEKDYLLVYSLADQILEQAIEYSKKETIIEQELELTKAFPFKITIKKNLHETNESAFAQSLVVYRDAEELAGRGSRLGFHINPYNFDSTDELEVFRYLRQYLDTDEDIVDVYFTGGVTNDAHNEFYFEYFNPAEERIMKYFPDFLVETTKNRYLVIEVKASNEKHAYEIDKERFEKTEINRQKLTSIPFAKEVGFREFQELNRNFEYHIIFNGTVVTEQQRLIAEVKALA